MVREILSEQIIKLKPVEWEGAREKSIWGRGCAMPASKKRLIMYKEAGEQQQNKTSQVAGGKWRKGKQPAAWRGKQEACHKISRPWNGVGYLVPV